MTPGGPIHAKQSGLAFAPGQRVLDSITGQDGTITRARWTREGASFHELYNVTLQDGAHVERGAADLVAY